MATGLYPKAQQVPSTSTDGPGRIESVFGSDRIFEAFTATNIGYSPTDWQRFIEWFPFDDDILEGVLANATTGAVGDAEFHVLMTISADRTPDYPWIAGVFGVRFFWCRCGNPQFTERTERRRHCDRCRDYRNARFTSTPRSAGTPAPPVTSTPT